MKRDYPTKQIMESINRLMEGAIDFHVHADPDPFHERRLDALDLARDAKEAGMRAVVMKCHHYCTAPIAYIVNKIVPGFTLVGSLTVNRGAGGLTPEVVEVAAKGGAKVIWMPTYSSGPDTLIRAKGRSGAAPPVEMASEQGLSLIEENGRLVPSMSSIFEIVRDYGMVLGTGHISLAEIYVVTEEARDMGIKVTITHPLSDFAGSLAAGNPVTVAHQKELIGKGAYIEHCFADCMPITGTSEPEVKIETVKEIVENIRVLGAEHCIVSTDFGKKARPCPTEGFRIMTSYMLQFGLSEKDLETLVKVNPAKLLDLT